MFYLNMIKIILIICTVLTERKGDNKTIAAGGSIEYKYGLLTRQIALTIAKFPPALSPAKLKNHFFFFLENLFIYKFTKKIFFFR